ncbi:hypothetical protein Tco_0469985, partial [Tanacetum coccineum]
MWGWRGDDEGGGVGCGMAAVPQCGRRWCGCGGGGVRRWWWWFGDGDSRVVMVVELWWAAMGRQPEERAARGGEWIWGSG